MKKSELLTLMVVASILLMVSSCKKTDDYTKALDRLNDITGNYEGSFSTDNFKVGGDTAYAEIRHVNGTKLEIHCYGDILDTTFIMEMYANHDSIMLCATGDDFESLYGHQQGEHHMGHMGDNENEWTHHITDDHTVGDPHFGGFNTENHSFKYKFVIKDVAFESITFEGKRIE